jgi:hypothetical protein
VKNLSKKAVCKGMVRRFDDVFADIVRESAENDEMKKEIMECARKVLTT